MKLIKEMKRGENKELGDNTNGACAFFTRKKLEIDFMGFDESGVRWHTVKVTPEDLPNLKQMVEWLEAMESEAEVA